jgi:UDP-glucose 4-epimerase
MNILILGAAGFIGTNLTMELLKNRENYITLVDSKKNYFDKKIINEMSNVEVKESSFEVETDFDTLLIGQEIVYHLASSTVPSTSNQQIPLEMTANVVATAKLLDACVRCGVKEIVFISSGGTVYGKEAGCPLKEDTPTYPINSYGVQKVTIEKLLYLYEYMYGLDYRVIRLANPYGPYQRPNGVLGAVTTFTYQALKDETIKVYGDGEVIRDFIYIDDAVYAIATIANGNSKNKVFNVGSGKGTSINEVLQTLKDALKIEIDVQYLPGRKVDVPINYLDISRYEKEYGRLYFVSLKEGIKRTAEFMKQKYDM